MGVLALVWEAVWPVVSQPDWYGPAALITFVMGFCIVVVGSMRDVTAFAMAGVFGAGCATCIATDPLGWGSWRLLLLIPVSLLVLAAILLVAGLQVKIRRWWRVMRGRPTQADARALVAKAMNDRDRAAQVCDALSRAPDDPHADYYRYYGDWPGRQTAVAPRTVVRWLRSGEPPLRLWQMLCVGKDDAGIRAYLDGSEQVDWAAVETMAALRAAAH